MLHSHMKLDTPDFVKQKFTFGFNDDLYSD